LKAVEKIIMGIDPGTNLLGYSVICADKNTIKILIHGVIKLKNNDHFSKLGAIYMQLDDLIRTYQPHILAIEAPFFGKNVQSMLKLGRAQGAAIIAGVNHNLEIAEYSPRKIKQSITGKGNASKEQVAKMLMSIFQIKELPKHYDETDALAAAVCHFNSTKNIVVSNKGFKNWSDFLKSNPGKLSKL